MTMENLVCLPARGAFPRSSFLLRFLLLCTDECTGNGVQGLIKHSATTGRLGLGLLGLEGKVFGLSALLARNLVEDLFLGLERQRVQAETARRRFARLGFGVGRQLLLAAPAGLKTLSDAK